MLINVTVLFENLADQFVFSCHSVNDIILIFLNNTQQQQQQQAFHYLNQ